MAQPSDRRAEERFPVNADTTTTFVSPVVKDFGAARIRDISMSGIGLLLSRRVEPGTTLAVTLSVLVHGLSTAPLSAWLQHREPERKQEKETTA